MSTKETYRFDDASRAIVVDRHDLPFPWINYLSNGTLHAFVSQAGGGMCWWKEPMTYRITRYKRHALPADAPGFYVYIRHADGTVWSPSFRPCDTAPDSWECRHTPGITEFEARKGNLEARLRLFVAQDVDALVWDLTLTNHGDEPEPVDVFAYVELSQLQYMNEATFGYYQKWAVKVFHDAESDAVLYMNYFRDDSQANDPPLVYFAATRKSVSYSCNRDRFCGNYRDERNPIAVEHGQCDNETLNGGEGCASLHVRLDLPAGASENTSFFLGATPGVLKDHDGCLSQTLDTLYKVRLPGFSEDQLEKTRTWWQEHLDVYQCELPDTDAQRQVNTWNPVQCVHTGRYSRSVSQSANGVRGVGFRDTAQDMMAIAYRKPEWARERLLYLCTFQFEEGWVEHEVCPHRDNLPAESKNSDNHLWLPMLAHAIVSETGDLGLLDEAIPFLAEDRRSHTAEVSLWDHLMRAFDFTENNLGTHGLPLILRSDWNDHFGTFGRADRGETVMVAQQYIYAMRLMLELADARGDAAAKDMLNERIEKQCRTLNEMAWEGRWWVRGFDDEGNPVGVSDAEYGRIWLNSQSWAVFGRVGEHARLIAAMDSVREHLDSDLGVRIFSPGFPTYPEVEDPKAKWLAKGCGENASIFCHANTWAIIAEAMLGRADNAWKYYRQVIPHVASQHIGIERYRSEPYAYVSTIFAPEHEQAGWANINQVTGTAAWMDVAATQYLLGIRPAPTGLLIDPCIPADWKGYKVTRRFRGCHITIEVRNPHGAQKGITSLRVDDEAVDISHGPLLPASAIAGCGKARVIAVM